MFLRPMVQAFAFAPHGENEMAPDVVAPQGRGAFSVLTGTGEREQEEKCPSQSHHALKRSRAGGGYAVAFPGRLLRVTYAHGQG